MKISHNEIIEIVRMLGLMTDKKGICYGIALNCEIAIVLGQTNELLERFQLMSHLLGDNLSRKERLEFIQNGGLLQKIKDAKEQIKILEAQLKNVSEEKKSNISNIKEQLNILRKITDIEIFCQNVSIAFFPDYYSANMNVFEQKITGLGSQLQNKYTEEKVLKVISPKALEEQGGLTIAFDFELGPLGSNRVSKVNMFFWLLAKIKQEIAQIDAEIHLAINIGGPLHAITSEIATSFNSMHILMIDPNRLPATQLPASRIGDTLVGYGHPVFGTIDNVRSLWGSAGLDDRSLSFQIKTTGKNAELVKRIFKKHLHELELCNQEWLPAHFAAFTGNLDILRELNEEPAHYIAADSKGNTPISIAIQKNDWNLLAHFLLHVQNYHPKDQDEMDLIIAHRNDLKDAFFKMLNSINTNDEKFDFLTNVINQKNMLGNIIMQEEDSIAAEVKNQLKLVQRKMGLFGEKQDTIEIKLHRIADLLIQNINADHSFIKDRLVEPLFVNNLLNMLTDCLFNAAKSDVQIRAAEICQLLIKISDEEIKLRFKNFLGNNPIVKKYLILGDLKTALCFKAIIDLSEVNLKIKNEAKLDDAQRQNNLIKFYSDPNHLQAMLRTLIEFEREPDMNDNIKAAYSALNKLWKDNIKIQDSFKVAWKNSPKALDLLYEGFKLEDIVVKLKPMSSVEFKR